MPRRSHALAAAEPTAKNESNKDYTAKGIEAAARALRKRREQAVAAARWAFEKGHGSKRAATGADSPFKDVGLTYNMIQPLLTELKLTGQICDIRDHHNQILTNEERRHVAAWLLACADGQDPKDRSELSFKVRKILRARHAANKKKKYGKGSVRLNQAEFDAVNSKSPRLSKMFFEHFYPWCRAHDIEISEGTDHAQDEKRSAKMHEGTIKGHFYAEFGLEAELIDAGVMDPETKVIKDPRRVLNSDETPQPIDMPQKGSRNKVAKRKGQAARKAGGCNKECVTVNMAWDLSGHLYGPQLVELKRKELTDDMVVEPPRGAQAFDDATDVAHKQSRFCLLSRTADGMQTQQSMIEYLEHLDKQITARSNADVAAATPNSTATTTVAATLIRRRIRRATRRRSRHLGSSSSSKCWAAMLSLGCRCVPHASALQLSSP
tara:strand:+ start:965 stop:2272 length:1308 start_codon:yes stop_codon:yes gene_type:complete